MKHALILLSLTTLIQVASAQVTYDRILHAENEPGNWLTYSGNYSGHRYSPLDQIHAGQRRAPQTGVGLPDRGDA